MSTLVGVLFFMLTVSIVIIICLIIRYVKTSNASIFLFHISSIKANSVKLKR